MSVCLCRRSISTRRSLDDAQYGQLKIIAGLGYHGAHIFTKELKRRMELGVTKSFGGRKGR